MIVKIVKEDNSTSKKSLVKKKIQDDVKSEKKVSEFITSVDPNSNKPKKMNRYIFIIYKFFIKFVNFLKEFFIFLFNSNDTPYTGFETGKSDRKIIPEQCPKEFGKKTLVIDLDETLVHSTTEECQCDLEITMKSFSSKIYVTYRPGVFEFLEYVSKKFELILFTASVSEYADEVINALEKKMTFAHRLYRGNCTLYRGSYLKDLSQMNRPMKDVILLDNSPLSFLLQPENGLLIKNFYFDKSDTELFNEIIPILDFFADLHDIRPIESWRKLLREKKPFTFHNMKNEVKTYNFDEEEESNMGNMSSDSGDQLFIQKDSEKITEKLADDRTQFNSPVSKIEGKFEFEFKEELEESMNANTEP